MNEYLDLLKENRNYRFLWLGSVVSQFGDWFNLIASAALIANLTSTGAALSYLFLARFLPLFFFSSFAGVLADRYDRRYVMIASDLLRAVTVMGLLLIRQADDIWLLYLLTITQFALSSLFVPARTAVIANVVKQEELVAANALDSLTWSTMLAFGAFLGGIVAAGLGVGEAFVMDAVTFLASAVLVSRVTIPAREKPAMELPVSAVGGTAVLEPTGPSGGWFEFLEGLRYLRGQPFILGLALVKAAGSLAWGAFDVVQVTYAEEIFPLKGSWITNLFPQMDAGTATLGLAYAVIGLGTGFGPLVLRRLLGDEPVRLRWAITAGFVLLILGAIWLSVADSMSAFFGATLIRTVGTGTIWVFSAAMLQMIVPDRVRGRVFAFEFAMLTLTQSISTIWAGLIGQDRLGFDVRQIALSMSVVATVMALLWLIFHLRTISRPQSQLQTGD
ncbi:MAG: MFS transporter [Candidatus Promineifilaceae bacterium]